jgi:hypothetical protein
VIFLPTDACQDRRFKAHIRSGEFSGANYVVVMKNSVQSMDQMGSSSPLLGTSINKIQHILKVLYCNFIGRNSRGRAAYQFLVLGRTEHTQCNEPVQLDQAFAYPFIKLITADKPPVWIDLSEPKIKDASHSRRFAVRDRCIGGHECSLTRIIPVGLRCAAIAQGFQHLGPI